MSSVIYKKNICPAKQGKCFFKSVKLIQFFINAVYML